MKDKSFLFGLIAVIVATIYSFSMEFFSLEMPDTFYYASDYLYSGELDLFRPLNYFLFRFITNIFGKYVVIARIFNWLFYYLSYVLVYLFLCKDNANKNVGIWCMALGIMTIPLSETTAFNGNSLTVLFLICTFISIFYFLKVKGKWAIAVVLCFLMCVMSRISNVVLLPILVVSMPLICKNWKEYGSVLLFLMISLVLLFVIYVSICGGVNEVIFEFKARMTVATDTSAADHSFAFLLQEYLHTLKDVVSYIKYLAIIATLPFVVMLLHGKIKKYFVSAVFVILIVGFVLWRSNVFRGNMYGMNLFLISTCVILEFEICVISIVRRNWNMVGCGLMPMLFSACAASGADSGLLYMISPLYAFMPWIVMMFVEQTDSVDKKDVCSSISALIGLAVCAALYVRNDTWFLGILAFAILIVLLVCVSKHDGVFKLFGNIISVDDVRGRIYCVPLFIIMVILVLLSKFEMNGDGGRMSDFKFKFSEKELKWIYTSEEESKFVRDVMNDYRDIKNREVVFYGYYSSIFGYLTGVGRVAGSDFTQKENSRNIAALEKALNNNPVVFLIPQNPSESPLYELGSYPVTDSILLRRGYRKVEKEIYAIYYPVID